MTTTTTNGTVTSADGTTIHYHRLGRGPGLVILHGAMQTGRSQLELAQALAGDFTCYLPDRRGRGGSGPAGPAYGLQREVEDLDAVLRATGAPYALGVSSGAIITLHTARVQPALRKVVIFEPPLDVHGSHSTGWLPRLDRELAEGRISAALVTGMRAGRMGPPIMRAIPRPLMERLTSSMVKSQERAVAGVEPALREPTFGELAPTLHEDLHLVAETAGDLEAYRSVRAEVLLVGGARSAAYLRAALGELQRVLPRARRVTLPGLDHNATSNAARRGRPEPVAEVVRRFLSET
ncbi:alpha/beta fold hydrolase [Nonomuraea aridisoli]|uniref:Alpha/beta hydrolase n=1 Tax=Nonomuraea aridisoli TaxID=2070368 RepID=A0A2W2DEW8_9ACTN|nr:alpha/beta hydrolase [Nonomuraea aridisoli]PZG03705.1 alpha/beta hydrolase [Nonomuraea aridisoli]